MRWVIAALVAAFSFPAVAHDDAQWIQDGQYRNQLNEWCCGPADCERLADGDVSPADGGYLIKSFNEHVPQIETMPFSPDGYWRCRKPDGTRRCFFIPPSGS